jgi:hypothetical protein
VDKLWTKSMPFPKIGIKRALSPDQNSLYEKPGMAVQSLTPKGFAVDGFFKMDHPQS